MATCIIGAEIVAGCKVSPGVHYLYAANFPADAVYTEAGGLITAIKDGAVDVTFYKLSPNKLSGEFINNFQTSIENGALSHEQKAMMNFNSLSQDRTDILTPLLRTNSLIIAVSKEIDATSGIPKTFLMGKYGGADLTGGSAGLGKAGTDLNGYSVELTAYEGEIVQEINGANIVGFGGSTITIV